MNHGDTEVREKIPGRSVPPCLRGSIRAGRIASLACLVVLGVPRGGWAAATPPPAPVRAWTRIVIHHSATQTGSAERFGAHHRARGMVNGLAYHFVIDNGSAGTRDGFIEVGDRWLRQLHGGHCRQTAVNETGIGICLVGDFTREVPSRRQLDALVLLIRGLQDQFGIPDRAVVAHGEIAGELSECPGRSFPWSELRGRLAETLR